MEVSRARRCLPNAAVVPPDSDFPELVGQRAGEWARDGASGARCDPGHDDAVAIVVAAHRAQLIGVTTVAGNVGLDDTTRNVLAVLQLLDLDVPVHSGAAAPTRSPRVARHATPNKCTAKPGSPARCCPR